MALSNPVSLATITDGSPAKTVYVTASVSPPSNCLLLASLTTDPETAPFHETPTATTTLSNVGTWTWYRQDSDPITTLIGVAKVTGAPGSGTVTFTFATQRDNFAADLSYVTGHDTTTPVARSIGASGTGTTASATLGGTPAATSVVYVNTSMFLPTSAITEPVTPKSGFTEVTDIAAHNATYDFGDQQEVQYLNGSATTAISSTWATSRAWIILGIEIAAAAGAAAPVRPPLVVNKAAIRRGAVY